MCLFRFCRFEVSLFEKVNLFIVFYEIINLGGQPQPLSPRCRMSSPETGLFLFGRFENYLTTRPYNLNSDIVTGRGFLKRRTSLTKYTLKTTHSSSTFVVIFNLSLEYQRLRVLKVQSTGTSGFQKSGYKSTIVTDGKSLRGVKPPDLQITTNQGSRIESFSELEWKFCKLRSPFYYFRCCVKLETTLVYIVVEH